MQNFEKINEKSSINIEGVKFQFDDKGFVRFGDVAHKLLDQQAQYASYYIDGALEEYPNLGEGLNFKGDASEHYSVKIHKDSIEEFVKRVRTYRS